MTLQYLDELKQIPLQLFTSHIERVDEIGILLKKTKRMWPDHPVGGLTGSTNDEANIGKGALLTRMMNPVTRDTSA
jgi:hypothetical protein